MKKLLFLFLVLLSCEKEPVTREATYCWNCRLDKLTATSTFSSMKQYCGYSVVGIEAFEKSQSYVSGDTTVTLTCFKVPKPGEK